MAGPLAALEQRRADVSRHATNSARQAISSGGFITSGWGEVQAPDPIIFNVVFTSKPAISYSFEIDHTQTPLVAGQFPRGSGFVYEWILDTSGHFTGAYVAVTLDTTSANVTSASGTGTSYIATHSFVFIGDAYKALPGLAS